ncbi:MAG: GGDEF domain-containing protein [Butyrivibrio sp.]|nr:GGDEF domain-containing protein [Butyrivibrio sp.]
MSDQNYESFKQLVNMCQMPCAVISVEKMADGSCGEVRMLAINDAFSMTGEDVEGKLYTEKLPQDPKLETMVYNAAFKNEPYCSYIDTTRLYGYWTQNIITPLKHDEGSNIGYCQFMYSLTKEMDSGKYSIIAPDIASFVIRTCLNLRKAEDFYTAMDIVAKDIREFTDSFATGILTISRDVDQFEVISGAVRNNTLSIMDVFADIPYRVVETWEWLIADTDCIIIRNEEDMRYMEAKAPDWVKTLRENDVTSLCLVPFIHQNTVIGYLYISNFNTDKITRFKDTIELVSFFLSSEAAHHLFIDKLKSLSNVDVRTGVLNRNAMNTKVDELAVQLRYDPKPFSVAFCYLNTLKTINSTQGHDAGNNLLKEAGRILKEVFVGDYVYRSSGDEFAVISTGSTEKEFEEKIALLKEKASNPEGVYFTIGYYTDSTEGKLHSAMHYANEYEQEYKEEFYYNNPDMVK